MKLSDMFANLAENARMFEARAAEWQDQMTARNDEMMASARKWQETAMERQSELSDQMRGYLEQANENVRSQWTAMQSAWEEQFQKMRQTGEEMRAKAGRMPGADFAAWSEAYAAQMVSMAQRMQEEAMSAIAAATEARGAGKDRPNG